VKDHDWSRFVQRVSIKADHQRIYDAWGTQKGLESWFLRKAEFTKPEGNARDEASPVSKGDTYEWLWHGWSDDVVERGTILEANGKNFVKFTFGKAGVVSVKVKDEAGETILELVQEDIPTDEDSMVNFHVGCTKGWVFYLANLKSILEGGIDLRNKNVDLTNMINA